MLNSVTAHPTQEIWMAAMFPVLLDYYYCFRIYYYIIIIIIIIIITNT